MVPFRWRTSYGILLLLLAICFLYGCGRKEPVASSPAPDKGNSVAAFLKNAERQSEDDGQRREIQHALRDMLEKSPDELRQTRYSDYGGQANAWSITQLLQHYFVSSPPATLDEQRFFQDVRGPAARAAIEHQLDEVTRALQ